MSEAKPAFGLVVYPVVHADKFTFTFSNRRHSTEFLGFGRDKRTASYTSNHFCSITSLSVHLK